MHYLSLYSASFKTGITARITVASMAVMLSLVLSSCQSEDSSTISADQAMPLENTHSVERSMALPSMVVYKSPTCGCCQSWVDYVEKAGFAVNAINHDDVDAIKIKHGLINPALKSCHTAIVDGYVIEGHVPVSDIERLLAERPNIVGLTAPGMPMMSPGMASEIPKDYDVLAFDKHGKSRVYSSY